jgi:hypothetical protein
MKGTAVNKDNLMYVWNLALSLYQLEVCTFYIILGLSVCV